MLICATFSILNLHRRQRDVRTAVTEPHLNADIHEGGVGVNIAHDATAAHLRHQLQCLAELLVRAALRNDRRVCIHIAQVRQLVVIRQPPQPIKQLRSPAHNISPRIGTFRTSSITILTKYIPIPEPKQHIESIWSFSIKCSGGAQYLGGINLTEWSTLYTNNSM